MKLLQRGFEFGASIEDVRALLTGLDGFQPFTSPAPEPPSGASVEVLGAFRGGTVLLLEAIPGRPFPEYAARRTCRAALEVDVPSPILIFTDSAHSTFVWTWRAALPTGHTRYAEFNVARRGKQLRKALAAFAADRENPRYRRAVNDCGEDDPVAYRLSRTLVPPRERGSGSAGDRIDLMIRWIERIDDPEQVRAAWRRLRSFSVLDHECLDGRRLIDAGTLLEMAMIAVLERMQSFVDDALMQRERRRPEHLRDLRTLTEASEDRIWDYDRTCYIRRLIVQQNLFATVSSRAAGRSVLRDLLEYAGTGDFGIPFIDCNIWRRQESPAVTGRCTRPVDRADRTAAIVAGPDEELALHRKAWEIVRRVRLSGGDYNELRSAGWQLQRRRQLLLRQLGEIDSAGASPGAGGELVFSRASAARGFSVRLGEGLE